MEYYNSVVTQIRFTNAIKYRQARIIIWKLNNLLNILNACGIHKIVFIKSPPVILGLLYLLNVYNL